jgi:hypothetical protein
MEVEVEKASEVARCPIFTRMSRSILTPRLDVGLDDSVQDEEELLIYRGEYECISRCRDASQDLLQDFRRQV